MNRTHLLALLPLLLAGCEAGVTVDLSVADTDGIEAVFLKIAQVELLDEDGDKHELSADADEGTELRSYVDGQTLRLVDQAEIDEGRYTGLRLEFDDTDASVQLSDGSELPLSVDGSGEFVDIDVEVEEDDTAELTAVLDLRFSLERDGDTYRLDPSLIAMESARASSISGSVDADTVRDADCRDGRALAEGVAVYAYEGSVDDPTDIDRDVSGGPYASTPVRSAGSGFTYDFAYLPAGRYTLAWTCEADDDDPDAADDLEFQSTAEVVLDENESEDVDLD